MIPHVTGEVKLRLRELAVKTNADVVFVEIGGTVGDIENAFYIEAMRELAYEEGPNSCCFVALTYILEPRTLGEQKSKAAQLGIKQLMQTGIQPDIIACRAEKEVGKTAMQKISVFGNVPVERVFSMHDSASIYSIPSMLRDCGLDFEVCGAGSKTARNCPRSAKNGNGGATYRDKLGRKPKKSPSASPVNICRCETVMPQSFMLEHAGIHRAARSMSMD